MNHVQKGDRVDIRALFVAHQAELRRYLSRTLRDTDAAADLTQETFLRFAEQGQNVCAVRQPRAYLFRMAYHLAIDHLRRRNREQVIPVSEDAWRTLPDDSPTPEQQAKGRDDLMLLRQALQELPERTQQVFQAVKVHGLTYQAAARRLGISESSVQKHLTRALSHVMTRLGR